MSASAPVLLALDTATERVYASLSVGSQVRALDLLGGSQASAQLLPALQGLIRDADLTWSDLDAIAFGAGPGAFTGLRTACSVTQGLALGADCPVIPLDTLMVVAEDARQQAPQACQVGDVIWVLQDARMEEMYVGAFTWTGSGWQEAHPAQLWPLSEPAQRWAGSADAQPVRIQLCGNALDVYPERFAEVWASGIQRLGQSSVPRGEALAALAQSAWQAGLAVDVALALPRYVRDKVAQTTAERRAAAQASKYVDRDMNEADLAAVLAMEREACSHAIHAWTEENYRSSLQAEYWVQVRCDARTGAVLAVCVAMDGVDEIHLLNIAVAKSVQGKGLAREMLSRLYARCRAQKAMQLWLEVRASNAPAKTLYLREGFVEVGLRKAYYPSPNGREDAIVMCRQMDAATSVAMSSDQGGARAVE